MRRTIPVALICWFTLVVSSRGQDVFVPRELKARTAAKPEEASQPEKNAAARDSVVPKTAATGLLTEPPANLHPEKAHSIGSDSIKAPASKAPFVIPHSEKGQTMKFEPVKPLSGKGPTSEVHPEKVPLPKIEPEKAPAKERVANLHPEKLQPARVEPAKAPAVKETAANSRSEKAKSEKEEKASAAKETAANSGSEKTKSGKVEPKKPTGVKQVAATSHSEKTKSAKVEEEKPQVTKATASNSRTEKTKATKVNAEKAPAVKEIAANARPDKAKSAKVEAKKAPAMKEIATNSQTEKVQSTKPEPIKMAAVKEPIVNLRPEKPQVDKADSAKSAAVQEPTVDIQLSDRSTETASTRMADGFDFPVGKPEAEGYYKARGFRSGGHMGEDWDGIRGGDTDLKDPIYCIGNGIVVFARDVHRGWGNVVIVRHAFREGGTVKHIDSLYGHLHSILVKRGQRVARGQQVGTMGTAHGQYDAHLHLEIRKNLEIGMSRAKFAKNFSNYYDPSQFIESHRHLAGGGASFRVAMNTFTHDGAFHFDDAPNYSPRKHSTAQSAAALKQALSGTR